MDYYSDDECTLLLLKVIIMKSTKTLTTLQSLLKLCLLFSLSIGSGVISSSYAQDLNDESALDSMEDLVSDLDDTELQAAIAEESVAQDEPEPEPEPTPEVIVEATPEVSADATPTVSPNESVKTTELVKPSGSNGGRIKPNALLILKTDRKAKVWINGKYRGRLTGKKARRFPVRAGETVVTAKGVNGVTRRIKRSIKAKSRVRANIRLMAKGAVKAAKRRHRKGKITRKKNVKRAKTRQRVRKATKRASKKARKR